MQDLDSVTIFPRFLDGLGRRPGLRRIDEDLVLIMVTESTRDDPLALRTSGVHAGEGDAYDIGIDGKATEEGTCAVPS